jgi:cob(I)alamin adenosyltransferase
MPDKGGKKGLIHIYTGEGKGKTTAALGLSIRALGMGLRVLFVQFFKLDEDSSGEKEILSGLKGVRVLRSSARHPFFTGGKTDMDKVRDVARVLFKEACERAGNDVELLVLDEVLGAVSEGFITSEELIRFLDNRPSGLEVVLTGRDAPVELIKRADYVTEMLKIKHPFDAGTKAREGIEF